MSDQDTIATLTARVATLEEENKAFWPVVPDEETKLMLAVLDVVASGQKTLSASAARTAASLITRLSIERGQYREAMETYSAGMTKAVACQAKAESELAAARKVEDGEVVRLATMLRRFGERSGDECGKEFIQSADLLTRLSDALKEAEAKLETIRRALFPDPEHHITHHARYNLEGALADLEAGQNDPTVRRTLKRVAGQIAAAERALQTKDTTE